MGDVDRSSAASSVYQIWYMHNSFAFMNSFKGFNSTLFFDTGSSKNLRICEMWLTHSIVQAFN